ncbi:MAG TPA: mechanosensitive ion channel family protein, partial [Fimbriimonadaceae bacterium]|nr:mechanosensitive ion channel family protein [Fimbriimonadaceae bacterium]
DRAEKLLVPLASKLIRAVIVTTGLLIAVAELTNVNIAALVTSLGIGGLVVALAAKDSIENVFGSVTILFDMPFAIGDWVKIDKVEGVVEEINLRSTRIRTFEDTVITLPNANLIRAAVENFGARRVRRQKLSIRLSSDNSPNALGKLTKSVREYLSKKAYVQHERVIVALDSVDDAAIGLFIQCHFEAPTQKDEMRMRDELITEVLTLRDKNDVLLAGESRAAQDARHGKPPLK